MSKAPHTYTPGYRDSDGCWYSARSNCCGTMLMQFDEESQVYIYYNKGPPPPELFCRRCNAIVVIAKAEESE